MNHKTKTELFVGINLGHHDASCCELDTASQSFTIYEEERLSRVKSRGFYPFLSVNQLQNSSFSKLDNKQEVKVSFSSFMTDIEKSWELSQKKKEASFILLNENFQPKKISKSIIHHEAHLFSALPLVDTSADYLVVVADGCGSNLDDLELHSFFDQDTSQAEGYEMISAYSWRQRSLEQVDKKCSLLYWKKNKKDSFYPASFFTSAAKIVFGDWKHSGKVMGLSAYHTGELYSRDELFDKMYNAEVPEKLDPTAFDNLSDPILKEKQKICASVQYYYEEFMFEYLETLQKKTKLKNLILIGGCALNCVFNEKLRKKKIFANIYVPPWPNDEGISFGSTVASYYNENAKLPLIKNTKSPFRGMNFQYSERDIIEQFKDYTIEPFNINTVVELFIKGEVIGWYENQSECGPRALGHRSIYADPFKAGIKDFLNSKIKFRENFRPYGCSILEEDQSLFFEDHQGLNSPFMSFAPIVLTEQRQRLKEVIHKDQSIRIQTVDDTFDGLKKFLEKIKEKRGNSLIIHTSMNINKMPIVNSIHDAKEFFAKSNIKYMVFNDYLISKPV